MFQHAVHLGLSEKSPSREKLDSSLIAQEKKQLVASSIQQVKLCLQRPAAM